MNPRTIGRIDRLVGKPVCLALTCLRRLGRLFRAPADANCPVARVLFIKMIEQGATVLAYRALVSAVERVGRENVYFWVFRENRPILDFLDVIPSENVIEVRTDNPLRLLLDMLCTVWKIRRLKIDATVDMEFFARAPAILSFLTGARRRVGLHRFTSEGPYRGDLLTHRVQYNPYLHTAINYYILVESLWADPAQTPLAKIPAPAVDAAPSSFKPAAVERDAVLAILVRLAAGPLPGPLVLLNPNASDLLPLRKWPTDRFIELGRRVLRDHGDCTVAITGAPSECQAAAEVAAAIGGRCINLAGETTLRQLMVLYTIADVLVTNDSGPGHFASMTEVDTIVLFGPETPALFGPLGRHAHVVWANLACSPCVNVLNHRFSPCNDNVCMQRIEVDQVHGMVNDLLQRRAKAEQS